jgi:hypothetical protein
MPLLNMERPPHLLQQLAVCDNLAGITNKRRQKFVFDRRQMDFPIRYEYLSAAKINADIAERENRVRSF